MAEHETSLRPTKGDVYIVIALALSSMVFAVLYQTASVQLLDAPLWACCLASILSAAPLLYRRRFPSRVAWTICLIYSVALVNSAMEVSVSQIILFLGVYSIGPWQSSRRTAFWSRLLLCVGMGILFTVSMTVQFNALGDMTVIQFVASGGVSLLTNIAFFGGAWIFGNRARNQRMIMSELRAANDEVRAQEQRLTAQALDLERVRIARELHDGIAHHITGVGIHAAAARRSLEKNPDRARESLKTIESSTRETVDELRALVYTLRDSDEATGDASTTKGNPSLGDVPELIESARRFGQTIEFTTIGEAHSLTPITEMSIYRVIQESLTNCSRYAGGGAEVDVRLRYGTTELEVEVSDSRSRSGSHGSGADPQSVGEADTIPDPTVGSRPEHRPGLGLGIVGMRERMSALGGSLEAGEKSRGGWLVRARIPYPRSTAEPTSETTLNTTQQPESDTNHQSEPPSTTESTAKA